MVRCKFVCNSILETTAGHSYTFAPVYGSEENKVYWEATPSGSFQMYVNGKRLFSVGREYLIDITEA